MHLCLLMLMTLAQGRLPEHKRTLWALWLMTALLGLVLIASSAWLLARWRLRYGRRQKTRDPRPLPDAWTEAGRRAEPATIDLDPPPSDDPPADPRQGDRREQPE